MSPLKTILGIGTRKAAALAAGLITLAKKKMQISDTPVPPADTVTSQVDIPLESVNTAHSLVSPSASETHTVKFKGRPSIPSTYVNNNRHQSNPLAAQSKADNSQTTISSIYDVSSVEYNRLIDERNRRARAEIDALQGKQPTRSAFPSAEVAPQPPQPSFWEIMNPDKTLVDKFREDAEARRAAYWKSLEDDPRKAMKELKKWDRQHRK